jgi:hypothetical protein
MNKRENKKGKKQSQVIQWEQERKRSRSAPSA